MPQINSKNLLITFKFRLTLYPCAIKPSDKVARIRACSSIVPANILLQRNNSDEMKSLEAGSFCTPLQSVPLTNTSLCFKLMYTGVGVVVKSVHFDALN